MTVAIALILDALTGDPPWAWNRVSHPVVLIGRAIGWADRRFNAGDWRRAKGAAVVLALFALAALTGFFLQALPGSIVEILVGAILIAQKSLTEHVSKVGRALEQNLSEARLCVAQIVGRDTGGMDESAIAKAAIESGAENFSDGVVAPVFWFLIGGLPGLLIYKTVNTADSMIGYLTPQHGEFGWAAARLDDALNWVPARLSAMILFIVSPSRGGIKVIFRDARLHRSPNAGWPEAAMAAALGVALAGPRSYHGEMTDYPFVNEAGRVETNGTDIDRAVRLLWRGWGLLLGLVLLQWVVWGGSPVSLLS